MNVAGNPTTPAQNVAIPINLAKEFLREAMITPDVGPVTERWLAAHAAFDSGNFAKAKATFEEILGRYQGADGRAASLINRYVTLMIERCDEQKNSK